MYLSVLLVDVGDNPDRPRPGRLWLRNLYRVHQRLAMAFPSRERKERDPKFLQPFRADDFGTHPPAQLHVERAPDQGFLFRIDAQPGNRAVIVVQSAILPDWDYAFANADFLLAGVQVKQYEPQFAQGTRLRFRLLANPTKKVGTIQKSEREQLSQEQLRQQQGRHGRRVPVPTTELEAWLARQASSHGFALEPGQLEVRPGWVRVAKGGPGENSLSLRSALYDGVLRVEDAARFRDALVGGIGPAKGFGFGLLSVARLKEEDDNVSSRKSASASESA
jgi:CRISPR system Cascade subunit CasE